MGDQASDRVFELAAELFSLLSAPTRLRLICALCEGERRVGDLLEHTGVTQPTVSQHLSVLYRAGIVGRRRVGAEVHYRIVSERVRSLCEAVCAEQGRLRAQQGVAGNAP